MKRLFKVLVFSLLALIIGLYLPVLVVAVLAGDTNYEKVLPYCLANSVLFLVAYLWFEYMRYRKRESTGQVG